MLQWVFNTHFLLTSIRLTSKHGFVIPCKEEHPCFHHGDHLQDVRPGQIDLLLLSTSHMASWGCGPAEHMVLCMPCVAAGGSAAAPCS